MTRSLMTVALLLLAPALASAQAPERPSADAYTQQVQRGIEQLASGDTAGATTTFQEALATEARRPEAQYYLATVLRMTGDLEGAVSGFQQSAALAQAATLPRWQARALHGVASTLERIAGRVEEARAAWQAYSSFADANPTVSDSQLGRARVQAIDLMNEQERAYVQVRQRIAEREEERRREAEQPRQRRRAR